MNEASERTQFDYLLNAMEHAGNEAYPAKAGYAGKRKALFAYVRDLEARAAVPAVQPPEFREVSWGVNSTMRPCKGMAVSEYAFRQWAEANGIALAAPQSEARQEQPKQPDSSYSAQPKGEAATARDALHDAATSLETIASLAGRKTYGSPPIETYMDTFMDVRLYAKARANAARETLAALSSTPAQGDGGTGGVAPSDGKPSRHTTEGEAKP